MTFVTSTGASTVGLSDFDQFLCFPLPHLHVIIQQLWRLPVRRDHVKVEIDMPRGSVGLLVTVERVQRCANRIPDDGIQLLHLVVGQVLAVEVLHRVADDHGKQKRVRRPEQIEGIPLDEIIARNADPIWLHQNEMWELMTPDREG